MVCFGGSYARGHYTLHTLSETPSQVDFNTSRRISRCLTSSANHPSHRQVCFWGMVAVWVPLAVIHLLTTVHKKVVGTREGALTTAKHHRRLPHHDQHHVPRRCHKHIVAISPSTVPASWPTLSFPIQPTQRSPRLHTTGRS